LQKSGDRAAVARQLGREPTTSFEVVARCADPNGVTAHPLVIRNHPVDPDGAPFPTRFWLTCREAVKAVSRLESTGEIGRLNERFEHDPDFREHVERAHREAARERATAHPPALGWGGVGGTRTGVKCLHAHYANYLAGGDEPIGAMVAAHVEPIHGDEPRSQRVAAIDMGTNTTRLLVAQPLGSDAPPTAEGGWELLELARDLLVTRLGQGVDEHGRIDDAAMTRTLDVIRRYGRRAKALGAQRVRVGATSAVRDASNRNELAAEVQTATGGPMEVISGEQEAALSFLGATRGLDRPAPFLVMDIGGGSTEFVLGDAKAGPSISTQLGSVRMTERVRPADPPTAEDLGRLQDEVDRVLESVPPVVPVAEARTFVAVAGTATTVQAVALDLDEYDPGRIHRSVLTADDAERTLEQLAAMTTAERAALPVMVLGRADVIVAGAAILVRAMRTFGFDEAVVSETDILDGLAMELIERGRASREDPEAGGPEKRQ
jgi:exopolyphosphatase/guanosine-5'-triphosphate,3'-diphosphate pyrophosphatase